MKSLILELIKKLRPQIFIAIIILGAVAGFGMYKEESEIAAASAGGIVALVKDIINIDR